VLRQFERVLLRQTGVAGNWSHCVVGGKTVQADGIYVVDPEQGRVRSVFPIVRPRSAARPCWTWSAKNYSDPTTQLRANS
jgi:DNA repair protein RecO (recombination protein O)